MRLVLSTRNPHKVREFGGLLGGVDVAALPAEVQLPPETGATFAENALVKARAAAAATGERAIADDSGIQAAALDGRPGVRSARFAGEDATDEENLAKLLREAPAGSALAYVCVVAYVDGGRERLFEGRCTGTLAAEPRGDVGAARDNARVTFIRIAWLATVLACVITGVVLLVSGYLGYAAVFGAVGACAAINLR